MKKGCIVVLLLAILIAVVAVFFGPALVERLGKLFYPKKYEEIVQREALEHELDENLIYAIIKAESDFDEKAVSRADACGLMQLTPGTFEWISSLHPPENGGKNIFDPSDNVHCGSALLRILFSEFTTLDEVLAAYNAGMGNVNNWLSEGEFSNDGEKLHTIPYPETGAYVQKVKEYYKTYQRLYKDKTNIK